MEAIQKHAAHWFPWILQNLQWKGIKTEHELCWRYVYKTIHRLAELPPADYIILAPEETTSNLYSQPHL